MRRLILMRHAKTERGSLTGEDFDRALTVRGRSDAALIGGVLAGANLAPDLALVSAAARARQTWESLAPVFPKAEVVLTRDLYMADPDELEAVIETANGAETVMVVAHNPGIHALAHRLLARGSAPPSALARLDYGFPTATAAAFLIDEAGRASYDGLFFAKDHGGGGRE